MARARIFFGYAVGQSGTIGLVGAEEATVGGDAQAGAAYVFRNLDTASGTVTQDVKLTASDAGAGSYFGYAASESGTIGLVGALRTKIGTSTGVGAAYVFRNLDTATGTVTQNVKLTASDVGAGAEFGNAVSESGTIALVGDSGTSGAGFITGAAYVFRNLDTASGTVLQNVKLVANDGSFGDSFGYSVSQSGSIGLVGSDNAKIGSNAGQGAAYLFRNLDTASGYVSQNVKITSSDGTAGNEFGSAVGVDGDQFIIGALFANGAGSASGKSYSGSVSSLTTLDAGNTSKLINGISFVSQDNWIIGQNTSVNQVTLSMGDAATVTAANHGVYIGQNAGANNNTLLVQGTVAAGSITISAASGASGNALQIANDGGATTAGTVSASNGITINPGGSLVLKGSSSVTTRIGSATPLNLAGGTFNLGGLSEGAAGTSGLGLLNVTATSTVDFGVTGTSSIVQFGGVGSHTAGQTLQVIDWEGTFNQPQGADQLLLAGLSSTFTSVYGQNDITFNGKPGYSTDQFAGYFEVFSAPEPSSAGLLALAGISLMRRRRRI